jgi:hypothetical protein
LVPWQTASSTWISPVRVAHHATPAAELVEAGSVHYAPCARPQGLAGFLDRRRPGREGQVAGDAAGVVLQHHAGSAHRLDHLHSEGADLHVRALQRGTARAVEAVLAPARLHDAEGAVQDPAMRINCHPDTEIVGAVAGVAIEPCPIVDIAVAGRRNSNRLRRLVDWEVVEFVEHGAFRCWADGSTGDCG